MELSLIAVYFCDNETITDSKITNHTVIYQCPLQSSFIFSNVSCSVLIVIGYKLRMNSAPSFFTCTCIRTEIDEVVKATVE